MPNTATSPPRRPASRGEPFDPRVPGVDYGALDDLVGYAIRRAQIAIYEDFLAALAPWDITPQRYSALTLIVRNDGMKLTELARVLGIARSGAVQLVHQLESLGLVARHGSTADKRAHALAATAQGRRALNRITAAVRAHDARISHRLSARQRRQLLALLEKLGSRQERDA